MSEVRLTFLDNSQITEVIQLLCYLKIYLKLFPFSSVIRIFCEMGTIIPTVIISLNCDKKQVRLYNVIRGGRPGLYKGGGQARSLFRAELRSRQTPFTSCGSDITQWRPRSQWSEAMRLEPSPSPLGRPATSVALSHATSLESTTLLF